MLLTCVPLLGERPRGNVPSNTGPEYNLTVAVTPTALGLYTPTFVRAVTLDKFVRTVKAFAALDGNPGMNIPTDPPCDAGEYKRDVTTTPPDALVNSTAPREFGTPNKLTQISSNARDSRTPSANTRTGCVAQLGLPTAHRYTAVTSTGSL